MDIAILSLWLNPPKKINLTTGFCYSLDEEINATISFCNLPEIIQNIIITYAFNEIAEYLIKNHQCMICANLKNDKWKNVYKYLYETTEVKPVYKYPVKYKNEYLNGINNRVNMKRTKHIIMDLSHPREEYKFSEVKIRPDGKLEVRGNNIYRQLGLGDCKHRDNWEVIDFSQKIVEIDYTSTHAVLLLESGEIFVTVFSNTQQIDIQHYSKCKWSPIKLKEKVVKIKCGRCYTIALLENGKIAKNGELDPETFAAYRYLANADFSIWKIQQLSEKVIDIECGSNHSALVLESGSLELEGGYGRGQLGIENTLKKNSWQTSKIQDKVINVWCGELQTIALLESGKAAFVGVNNNGQLGLGDSENRHSWVIKDFSEKIKEIKFNGGYTVMLLENGKLMVSGKNYYSRLGVGDKYNRFEWTLVNLNEIIVEIFANNENITVITNTGNRLRSDNTGHWVACD